MKPYMPQKKSRDPQNSQSQTSQASERPPIIDEVDKRLAELGLLTRTSEYQSQLEREADKLELKRQSLLRAAEKVYRLFGGGVPGASAASQRSVSFSGKLSLGILEGALEGLIKGLLRCFGPEKLSMFIGMKHIGIKP